MKGKRGVSPLIATVLLIAFAVALGAIIMSWGRDYVQDIEGGQQEKLKGQIECNDVRVEIPKINGETKICDRGTPSQLEYILDNRGRAIDGVQLSIIGDIGVENILHPFPINQGQIQNTNTIYSGTFGTSMQQIKFVPYIIEDGNQVLCPGSDVMVNLIQACS